MYRPSYPPTKLLCSSHCRLSALSRHFSSSVIVMAPIEHQCDYLVIGGGSGGLASARRASKLYGAKSIVIESNRLGGGHVLT